MDLYAEFCATFHYDPANPYAEDRFAGWLTYEDTDTDAEEA